MGIMLKLTSLLLKPNSSNHIPPSFREIIAPDLLGDLNVQLNLGPLLLLGQIITFLCRAESTLVAQAELIETLGAVLGSLLQPSNNLLLIIQFGLLAVHHTKDNNLVLGKMSKRAEVTGSGIIILEEVDVNIQLLEENLGDGLVATLGEPL